MAGATVASMTPASDMGFKQAVQICLQTHHLDSPNHQEPISDPGDYVIERAFVSQ